MLPFTQAQFLSVFADYNQAVWPAPILAYALALLVVLALWRPAPWAGRLSSAVLALMWLWTGIAYHWIYFRPINPAAAGFGALFLIQAGLLAYHAVFRSEPAFHRRDRLAEWVGFGLIGYAMVLYPLLGAAAGHTYPAAPTFGITPCPVTIFTFGVLLVTARSVPWWLLAIPLLWAAIGGSAAVLLAIPEDWMLPVAGMLCAALKARRRLAY